MNTNLITQLADDARAVVTNNKPYEYDVGFEHVEQLEEFVQSVLKECVWEIVKSNEIPESTKLLLTQRINARFGVK